MLAADLPSYAFERAAEKLSAGPRVFARLVEMMLDPRTDIEAVADLLKRDAVLSVRILRVANSAAVGGRASGSIADLEEALQRVGLSEVYRIAGIAVTLQSAHATLTSYGIGCQRMRENSLFEALAAEAIETVLEREHRIAYAGGLLRNFGRLLLDRGEPASHEVPGERGEQDHEQRRTDDEAVAHRGNALVDTVEAGSHVDGVDAVGAGEALRDDSEPIVVVDRQ